LLDFVVVGSLHFKLANSCGVVRFSPNTVAHSGYRISQQLHYLYYNSPYKDLPHLIELGRLRREGFPTKEAFETFITAPLEAIGSFNGQRQYK
jgi:hypothetical protein